MAPWARRLLAAVLSCTRTMRRLSKACLSIRYLIMRFRPLPCWAWSSQVQPISQAGKAGRNSAKRVVPTSCTPRRTASGNALPSRCSARLWRYQSGRVGPSMYCSASRLASARLTSSGMSASTSGSRRKAPRCRVIGSGLNMGALLDIDAKLRSHQSVAAAFSAAAETGYDERTAGRRGRPRSRSPARYQLRASGSSMRATLVAGGLTRGPTSAKLARKQDPASRQLHAGTSSEFACRCPSG